MYNDIEIKDILNNKNKISKYISNKTDISDNLIQNLLDIKSDKRVGQYVLHNLLGHYDDKLGLHRFINKTLKSHPSYNIINRQLKKLHYPINYIYVISKINYYVR